MEISVRAWQTIIFSEVNSGRCGGMGCGMESLPRTSLSWLLMFAYFALANINILVVPYAPVRRRFGGPFLRNSSCLDAMTIEIQFNKYLRQHHCVIKQ